METEGLVKQPLRLTTAQLFIRTPSLSTLRGKKKLDELLRSTPFPHVVSFRRVYAHTFGHKHTRTRTHTHTHACVCVRGAPSGSARVCVREHGRPFGLRNPFCGERGDKQFMEPPAGAPEEERVAWQPEGRWFVRPGSSQPECRDA